MPFYKGLFISVWHNFYPFENSTGDVTTIVKLLAMSPSPFFHWPNLKGDAKEPTTTTDRKK